MREGERNETLRVLCDYSQDLRRRSEELRERANNLRRRSHNVMNLNRRVMKDIDVRLMGVSEARESLAQPQVRSIRFALVRQLQTSQLRLGTSLLVVCAIRPL